MTNLYTKTKEQLERIYCDALLNSFRSWTDEILSGSVARTSSQIPMIKSINICLDARRRHLTIIKRTPDNFSDFDYYEFGMSTMGDYPSYNVWILVNVEMAEAIFKEYEIELR